MSNSNDPQPARQCECEGKWRKKGRPPRNALTTYPCWSGTSFSHELFVSLHRI